LALILIFVFLGNISFAWEAESMNVHFRRGEYFYEQGKYYEAIQEFQKVLKMYPGNEITQLYIKNAEEKIRQEPVLLKRAVKQKKKQEKQEAKIAKLKEKLDRPLLQKIQKEEMIRHKEEARLNKIKTRQQPEEAKEERLRELAWAKAQKETLASEKRLKANTEAKTKQEIMTKPQETQIKETQEAAEIATTQKIEDSSLAEPAIKETASRPFRLKLRLDSKIKE